jgi:hypothetical protein
LIKPPVHNLSGAQQPTKWTTGRPSGRAADLLCPFNLYGWYNHMGQVRLESAVAASLPWTVDPNETCSAADSHQTVRTPEFLVRRGPV